MVVLGLCEVKVRDLFLNLRLNVIFDIVVVNDVDGVIVVGDLKFIEVLGEYLLVNVRDVYWCVYGINCVFYSL